MRRRQFHCGARERGGVAACGAGAATRIAGDWILGAQSADAEYKSRGPEISVTLELKAHSLT
jgi:hypothetical protein